MIEYADPAERARRLAELRGFERRCWMRVAGFEPVYAIADEDLVRENDTKTSAVHFLRFEFSAAMIAAAAPGPRSRPAPITPVSLRRRSAARRPAAGIAGRLRLSGRRPGRLNGFNRSN